MKTIISERHGDEVTGIDVTDKVEFEWNDEECLPITKCVCGAKFDAWDYIISIYEEHTYKCPKCKVGLYFRPMIRVYKVK